MYNWWRYSLCCLWSNISMQQNCKTANLLHSRRSWHTVVCAPETCNRKRLHQHAYCQMIHISELLPLHFFEELNMLGLILLWVSFSTGRSRRWFPIHDMSKNFGTVRSKGLLFFMPSVDATMFHVLEERVKNRFFKPGMFSKKWIKHF